MGEGDGGNVTHRPPAAPADLGRGMAEVDRSVRGAMDTARPYLEAARPFLEAHRPTDAYSPRRTPTDQLGEMRRFIVFRPGRAFEVGAMAERGRGEPHGRPGAETGLRVIRDGRMIALPSRERGEAGRSGTREAPVRARPGSPAPASEAARAAASQPGSAPARGAGMAVSPEELSVFERIFMARFEGGLPIGDKLEPGQFKFLSKSEKAWVAFFQKFLPFTLQKKANAGEVELLVFRGLLQDLPPGKDGKAEKAPVLFLVSDMRFLDGKTDKFARVQIQGQELLHLMSEKLPGDVLGKDLMAEIAKRLGGEEFSYLSLSHKVVNPETAAKTGNPLAEAYRTPEQMREAAIREGTRDASQGIALAARTEQLVAEKLDINLRQALLDPTALDRRGAEGKAPAGVGLGGLFFGRRRKKGEGEFDTSRLVPYVPWWLDMKRPKKFKGKPRWWVPFLYFLATSALALAAVYIFRYWMSR